MLRFRNGKGIGSVLRFALAIGCFFALGRHGVASGVPVKDANQGVIQAVKQLEGGRLFDDTVEVYSRKAADGSVTVTFRRQASIRMVKAGQLVGEVLFTVAFNKDKVVMQKYVKNQRVPLDKRPQASQQERTRTRVVTAALAYLWKNEAPKTKDVAISIDKSAYENKETFNVWVRRLPCMPDGFVTVQVSPNGKVMGRHAAP